MTNIKVYLIFLVRKEQNKIIRQNQEKTLNLQTESSSCLLCLEKTKEDSTITMFTKTCLELIKHALELKSKNVQESCIRKEDAINTFIVLSKIKEYANKILKIYTLVDCSKKQLLN